MSLDKVEEEEAWLLSNTSTSTSTSTSNILYYTHPYRVVTSTSNNTGTHVWWQAGHAFLLVGYLCTGTCNTLSLVPLVQRGSFVVGCALLLGYNTSTLTPTPDTLVWQATFLAVNLIHLIILLFRLRPIKFSNELEQVYLAVFKPLRVSRSQFRKVLSCMRSIRCLKSQEVYAMEKVTKVDSLSLVLSGKLVVSQNQKALHIVFPHHFLDSPEWFGVSTDEYFQVSIVSMEESRVLIWHRDKLKLSIMSDRFLQAVFDHILGRDVVHKLMQVSETMAMAAVSEEDKALLVVKKAGDGAGITALINRQLQGDPNAWRLGRIEEADHETPV